MAKIQEVGHVVLPCTDTQRSIKFYTEKLGMELVNEFNEGLNITFFSFGKNHHDIAIVKVPEMSASPGASHTALLLEGGDDQLTEMYQTLKDRGVEIEMTADHTITKSMYLLDPDGNRIEIYSNSMEMSAAKDFIGAQKDLTRLNAPLDLEAAIV